MILLAVAIVLLCAANLLLGSVSIPPSAIVNLLLHGGDGSAEMSVYYNILFSARLPQTVTAAVGGAGLAVAGLQMQTVFHNPLAGPSVLGITSGASLGVALLVMLSGLVGGSLSSLGYLGEGAVTVAAITGALAVMAVIVFLSRRVRGNVTLLIIGMMIGYMAGAIIGVLKFFSDDEDVRSYVIWGLGSFSRLSGNDVWYFAVLSLLLQPFAFLLVKPMNLLLLGEEYARNLGLNCRRARLLVILSSGIQTAVVTAFCGPIMFLGLAVPHLCRGMLRTSDHRLLVPSCLLFGSGLALFCNLLSRLPGMDGVLPVNSVTALVGAPVVVSVLLKKKARE